MQLFYHIIARIISLAKSRYADWVKFSSLDKTQSYYFQGAARANKSKESFEWANFLLQFIKEDKTLSTNKSETLFSRLVR